VGAPQQGRLVYLLLVHLQFYDLSSDFIIDRDCRSRSYVRGQGQTVKIVYALPFEPVVQSRSILGLGLPSSASGNCE